MKRKFLRKMAYKIHFLKEIYIFFIKMACFTFYVTWKRDFHQNVKTNKRFKKGNLCNFKEIKMYNVLVLFLIKT